MWHGFFCQIFHVSAKPSMPGITVDNSYCFNYLIYNLFLGFLNPTYEKYCQLYDTSIDQSQAIMNIWGVVNENSNTSTYLAFSVILPFVWCNVVSPA